MPARLPGRNVTDGVTDGGRGGPRRYSWARVATVKPIGCLDASYGTAGIVSAGSLYHAVAAFSDDGIVAASQLFGGVSMRRFDTSGVEVPFASGVPLAVEKIQGKFFANDPFSFSAGLSAVQVPFTVRVARDDGGACWDAVFSQVSVNVAPVPTKLTATSD